MGILKGCIDFFSDNTLFFKKGGSPAPNRWHHGMANKKLKCALSYFKQTEHVVFIF